MRLNLGCGADYREGYVNVDFSNLSSEGKEIKVDVVCNFLTDDLPFEDVEEVIFHETLEHFNRFNGLKVLKKIYGVMKDGGIMHLTVPNAKKQLALLLAKMSDNVSFEDFEKAHEKWTFWKWHDDLAGGTRESDGFDGDRHKTFYSRSSLISVLEHVGFEIEEVIEDSSIRVKARR